MLISREQSSRKSKAVIALLITVAACVVLFQTAFKVPGVEEMTAQSNIAMNMELARTQLDEHYVPKSFRIYVVVSPARKEYMQNVLRQLGWEQSATLVSGVDKSTLAKEDLVKDGILKSEKSPFNAGRVAVALAHKKAIDAFLSDKNANQALILEDDVMKNPLLTHSPDIFIHKVMQDVPLDWNFINLGRCADWCLSQSHVKTPSGQRSQFVVKSDHALCAHAYALTKEGAQILADEWFPLKATLHDAFVSRLVRDGKLKGYAAKDQILVQNKKGVAPIAAPHEVGNTVHSDMHHVCSDWRDEIRAKYFGGVGYYYYYADGYYYYSPAGAYYYAHEGYYYAAPDGTEGYYYYSGSYDYTK